MKIEGRDCQLRSFRIHLRSQFEFQALDLLKQLPAPSFTASEERISRHVELHG